MANRNAASMGTYGAEWEHLGYAGCGNVLPLLDSLKGRVAIVCGGSDTVFEDTRDALHLIPDSVIFAVNDVGMFLPKLDHWVSLHADKLSVWKAVRWAHSKDLEIAKYHGDIQRPVVDYVWDKLTPCFCLSGYYAMQIAYLMGADRIILCGITGDERPRFFDLHARTDFGYGGGIDQHGIRTQLFGEMERLPEFKAKVRSMNGWTKEYFGGL